MTEYMEMRRNERQKKIMMTVIGLLAGAAVVFAIMWFVADRDRSDFARNAERHASDAAAAFTAFAESGDEVKYRYATADFYAFSQDIFILTQDTAREEYYTDCKLLYGLLIEHPDLCRPCAAEIADIMASLQSDIYNLTAYTRIKSLYDNLTEEQPQ